MGTEILGSFIASNLLRSCFGRSAPLESIPPLHWGFGRRITCRSISSRFGRLEPHDCSN